MTPTQMIAQLEDAPEETLTTIGDDPECEGVPEDVERAEDAVNRATEAIAAGQNGRALTLCREATEAAPSMTGAWVLLGMVAREAGLNKEALEAHRRVGELDPGRPDLLDTITELEKAVADEEAEAEAAAARGPGFLVRYSPVILATAVGLLVIALGIVLIVRHGRGAADTQFRQIMEQGYQAMGTQQFDQAEQQFTEALRLRPNDADALMWLQNAREGKQKAEAQAKRDYETANGKYPADSPGLSAGVILPTDEQKAADAAAAAGDTTVGPGGGTPGASYPGGGGGYPGGGGGGYPGGGGGYPGGGGGRRGGDRQSDIDGRKIMEKIATRTGGRFFEAKKKDNLEDIYNQIAEELRGQYLLSYTPDKPDNDEEFHKIALKAKNADLAVSTREGYYSAEK